MKMYVLYVATGQSLSCDRELSIHHLCAVAGGLSDEPVPRLISSVCFFLQDDFKAYVG